jgi:hypothetical protein
MKKKYICCFCSAEIISNTIDITGLIVITNFDKSEKKQEVQQLFCHLLCLKEKLPSSVSLYGFTPE